MTVLPPWKGTAVKDQVFPQYVDKSLDNFKPDDNPSLATATEIIRDYTNNLYGNRQSGTGLTIIGPNGVGKTHLACTVLTAALAQRYHVECIEADTYLELKKQSFDDDEGRLNDHLRFIRSRADFVLLDDLGREDLSDSGWSQRQLFNLVRYRWNRRKPTLITTNLTAEQMTERYSEGMPSYFMRANVNIVMDGSDWCAKDR